MKVLHYSDRSVENFSNLYRDCDILISTGDLSLFDFGEVADLKDKKPAFGVYGNHDTGNYMDNLGIVNLHNKVAEFGGYKWGGWQGCLKYKEGTYPMYTETEAKNFYENFPYVDILVLHAGPKDMLDDSSDEVHKGSEYIQRYVLEKKPKIVFCGHQYSDGFLDLGVTKIYRTYGARIINLDG